MSYPSTILLTLGISLGALSASAAIPLDGLTSNSPFGSNATTAANPVTPDTSSIEFRGVTSDLNGTFFALYDRSLNRGAWVQQNEKNADYNVVAYDATSGVVTVDHHGQKLSLALPSAKIETAAPSLPTMLAAPLGAPVLPAVAGANSTDQRKLESIAAEVRRRRALRVTAPAVTPSQP